MKKTPVGNVNKLLSFVPWRLMEQELANALHEAELRQKEEEERLRIEQEARLNVCS